MKKKNLWNNLEEFTDVFFLVSMIILPLTWLWRKIFK